MSIAMTSNAATLRPAFTAGAAELRTGTTRILDTTAQIFLGRVKAAASGRPGPRVQTGNYRRSWRIVKGSDGATRFRAIGTDAPQGWRLEKGFVGADSLGRMYNQPPFPHVGPAAELMARNFPIAVESLLSRAVAAMRAA